MIAISGRRGGALDGRMEDAAEKGPDDGEEPSAVEKKANYTRVVICITCTNIPALEALGTGVVAL